MKRWWIVSAGAAAMAAVLVASSGVSEGAGPFSFPHQPHISEAVVTAGLEAASAAMRGERPRRGGGKVDAECIVCHDFSKDADSHLSNCTPCHIGDAYLRVEVTAAPERARRAFPHAAHIESGDLSCFSCHRMQVDEGWVEFSVPPPSLGPRGSNGGPGGPLGEEMCADCHEKHDPLNEKVPQYSVTGDGKLCGTCHAGSQTIRPMKYRADQPAAGAVRPFRHVDHGGSDGQCETCHGDVEKSKSIWDYDSAAATEKQCAECHVKDAAGTPLVGLAVPPRESRIPYVYFSKFPHDAHLRPPNGEIQVSGNVSKDAPCRTCHYPETDAAATKLFPSRVASEEPVGRSKLVDYGACEPCHAEWTVKDHGVGWGACFKCHTGERDSDDKFPIGETVVERDTISLTSFATHHHPGVTRKGAPLSDARDAGKDCRECHVGNVDALTSRLRGKDFAHGPHVPGDPGNPDCLACHPTAATTSHSEDLRRFESRVGGAGSVTGDAAHAKGCIECHIGSTEAELGRSRQKASVPQFDHKAHVSSKEYAADTTGIACTVCHVPGGESGYQIPENVSDCTMCHTHDKTQTVNYARTGPSATKGESKLCLYCHEEVLVEGDAPPRRERVRKHLDLLPGRQYHDLGGECAACHDRDGLDGAKSDYVERIETARIRSSIHDDRALADKWFNDPRAKDAVDPERRCDTCHRREPRGYLRSLGR